MTLNTVLRWMAWPLWTPRRLFWVVFIPVFAARFVRHLVNAYQEGRLQFPE